MNTNTPVEVPQGIPRLLGEFFLGYKKQVQSSFSRWVTGESVGHSPTDEEALIHSDLHGGFKAFRQDFERQHPGIFSS